MIDISACSRRRTSLRLLLSTTAMLAGCSASEPAVSTTIDSEAEAESRWVPTDAPEGVTYLRIGTNSAPTELKYATVDGLAVFQGDIILGAVSELPKSPAEVTAQGVAITGVGYRWPSALVPFTIDAGLTDQARVTTAIRHWQERTNVRFILRDASNAALFPDFVTFQPGTGCSAHVGRQGGQQFVTLAAGCSTGNTIHEIGHALGFWHEQSREDRNSFVTINLSNVEVGLEHNFGQHISDGDDVGDYDYGSIMHYGTHAFSRNGLPTIQVLTPGVTIGQRSGLSDGDIAAAQLLYPVPTYAVGNRFFTMDYDGDGDDDLVIRGPGGEFFAYVANAGTFTRALGDLMTTNLSDRHGWNEEHRFFVADYDGDGDDDLILRNAGGEFSALRSERTHFVSAGPLLTGTTYSDANGWSTGNRFWVMDYDGDGDDDLVARHPSGEFVGLRSNGTTLTSVPALSITMLSDANDWNSGLRFFVADYDGDGKDDLITRNAGGDFNALRSNGTQLVWMSLLYGNTVFSDANGWVPGNRIYAADYDGDGDDDLVLRLAGGGFLALNSSAGALSLVTLLSTSYMSDVDNWNDANRFFVADVDGDGDDDLVARDSAGAFHLVRSSASGLTLPGIVANTTFRDP
ncbi:M12 family metallopeptidase [Myxococcus sp. MxC21-1]|uniref:M12 family metallopeptidase n=1 Tax=Myxococcus sp. MxC21-1 TaxID=3041439 RepID=UPI00292CFDA1|nr:M12 family metallopeptidase [Myxococcus sp. MxC21-1]WNZ61957.1 M12 family metallopeptidase [Myxococcus sp. MxC21-1]